MVIANKREVQCTQCEANFPLEKVIEPQTAQE